MDVKDYIKSWERITITIPDSDYPKYAYQTKTKKDRKSNKKENISSGLYNFSEDRFQLKGEVELSLKTLGVISLIDNRITNYLGKSYQPTELRIQDGLVGVINGTIRLLLEKNDELTRKELLWAIEIANNHNSYLPLKAVYVFEGEELYIGNLFKVLSRRFEHAIYGFLGKMLCLYIDWEFCRSQNNWEGATSVTAQFAILSHLIGEALHESPIQNEKHKKNTAKDNASNSPYRKFKPLIYGLIREYCEKDSLTHDWLHMAIEEGIKKQDIGANSPSLSAIKNWAKEFKEHKKIKAFENYLV